MHRYSSPHMGRREGFRVRGREVAFWAHNLFKLSPSVNLLAQPSGWFWEITRTDRLCFPYTPHSFSNTTVHRANRFDSSKYANKQPPGKGGTKWLNESAKQYARVLRAGSLQRDAVDLERAASESWLLVVVVLTLSAGGVELNLERWWWWTWTWPWTLVVVENGRL